MDSYLEGLRFGSEPGTAPLEEAMRYSLLAGGKRIRPVLALATAEALAREAAELVGRASAEIEAALRQTRAEQAP